VDEVRIHRIALVEAGAMSELQGIAAGDVSGEHLGQPNVFTPGSE
jgi:hypothetical protein